MRATRCYHHRLPPCTALRLYHQLLCDVRDDENFHDVVHAASEDVPHQDRKVLGHLHFNDGGRMPESVHHVRHHCSVSCHDVDRVVSLVQESNVLVRLDLNVGRRAFECVHKVPATQRSDLRSSVVSLSLSHTAFSAVSTETEKATSLAS